MTNRNKKSTTNPPKRSKEGISWKDFIFKIRLHNEYIYDELIIKKIINALKYINYV